MADNSSQNLGYEILGAVKIKDGLFIGDELAAQDLEFVVANKVTHIINCCGRNVPNHWESIGVVYLTYYWLDHDHQVILDTKDVVANECFHFLEEALKSAESILIHSVRGQSRSSVVLAAYIMKKYNWGLRKTMEFLSSRRPDITLKPAFLQQLSQYERRLMASISGLNRKFTTDWSEVPADPQAGTYEQSDELLLRNTYINSHIDGSANGGSNGQGNTSAAMANLNHQNELTNHSENDLNHNQRKSSRRSLIWSDGGTEDRIRLERHPSGDRPHCQTRTDGSKVTKPIIRVTGSGPGQALLPKAITDNHNTSGINTVGIQSSANGQPAQLFGQVNPQAQHLSMQQAQAAATGAAFGLPTTASGTLSNGQTVTVNQSLSNQSSINIGSNNMSNQNSTSMTLSTKQENMGVNVQSLHQNGMNQAQGSTTLNSFGQSLSMNQNGQQLQQQSTGGSFINSFGMNVPLDQFNNPVQQNVGMGNIQSQSQNHNVAISMSQQQSSLSNQNQGVTVNSQSNNSVGLQNFNNNSASNSISVNSNLNGNNFTSLNPNTT